VVDTEMYLEEDGFGDMDWIDLAQDMNIWWEFVNMAVNFRVP